MEASAPYTPAEEAFARDLAHEVVRHWKVRLSPREQVGMAEYLEDYLLCARTGLAMLRACIAAPQDRAVRDIALKGLGELAADYDHERDGPL
jgi:hypothetical protein